ncbi:hypothetical protein [Phenylobacterium sp.]|uniref:hypothetical protein n=1 Tax=Phenylobacterium sp. TaxID=1871053 RepID=UPI00263230DD|nr:hypothetical protein [Phenylobacterium sp.]
MSEHPVVQPIRAVDTHADGHGYAVGVDGVTRIEACTKSGLHADIAYVRVWRGEVCEAEFCQHNIIGVYFGDPS